MRDTQNEQMSSALPPTPGIRACGRHFAFFGALGVRGSMILRDAIAAAMLILTSAIGAAAFSGSPQSPSPSTPDGPPMAFYVAKGAPDACGRGCDTWIAVEGIIDDEAASRFRKFLFQTDRDWPATLPLYFSSPGGSLEQGLAMGRMLRQRLRVARVARTTVKECGDAQSQSDDACIKIKQSGRTLDADLSTRASVCSSTCVYLILGATTRQIEPAVVIGVHSVEIHPALPATIGKGQCRSGETEYLSAPTALSPPTSPPWGLIADCSIWLGPSATGHASPDAVRNSTTSASIPGLSPKPDGPRRADRPASFARSPLRGKTMTHRCKPSNGSCSAKTKSRALLRLLWTSDPSAVGSSSMSLIAGSEQPMKFVGWVGPGRRIPRDLESAHRLRCAEEALRRAESGAEEEHDTAGRKNRPDGHRDRHPRPRGSLAGAFRERLPRAAG